MINYVFIAEERVKAFRMGPKVRGGGANKGGQGRADQEGKVEAGEGGEVLAQEEPPVRREESICRDEEERRDRERERRRRREPRGGRGARGQEGEIQIKKQGELVGKIKVEKVEKMASGEAECLAPCPCPKEGESDRSQFLTFRERLRANNVVEEGCTAVAGRAARGDKHALLPHCEQRDLSSA